MNELQEILSAIQTALKAPKSQHNTFGGYNYRSCEDIMSAVKPLLGDATLTLSDDVHYVGDRYYIKAVATLSFGDKHITVEAFAREQLTKKGMDEAQITGACSSYARKYALNGLFLIDDVKDADSQDNSKEGLKNPQYAESSKSITKSVYDTMDAETKNAMNLAAMSVVDAFAVSDDAGFDEYIAVKQGQGADWQTAFWNLFDSKTRTKIKTIGTQRKEKQ